MTSPHSVTGVADPVRRRTATRICPRSGAMACGEAEHGSAFFCSMSRPQASTCVTRSIWSRPRSARPAPGTAVVAVLHDLNLAVRFADRIIVCARVSSPPTAAPVKPSPTMIRQVSGRDFRRIRAAALRSAQRMQQEQLPRCTLRRLRFGRSAIWCGSRPASPALQHTVSSDVKHRMIAYKDLCYPPDISRPRSPPEADQQARQAGRINPCCARSAEIAQDLIPVGSATAGTRSRKPLRCRARRGARSVKTLAAKGLVSVRPYGTCAAARRMEPA